MAPALRQRKQAQKAPETPGEANGGSAGAGEMANAQKLQRANSKELLVNSKSKWASFRTRTVSAVLMIAGLMAVLFLGHVPVVMLIFTIQGFMVRELFALAQEVRKERELPGFRLQQWYFYGAAVFFVYGRFLKHNVLSTIHSATSDVPPGVTRFLGWFLARHSLLSYMLWVFGFVLFVLSLHKGLYVYQFGQFAWTHMILVVVLLQSSCFVANVFYGLIWFVFPVSIVFINDIAAYLCGFFFGRTPLIKLSPKKTWEGFIGAFVCTLAVTPFFAAWLQQYQWLTCPRDDLKVMAPATGMGCKPDPLFQERELPIEGIFGVALSQPLRDMGWESVHTSWFQVHCLVLAAFASSIAPFGGFFASGFKRAFKIKDFSDTIPGHGGITDRMDCQMVMAVFSYLYITNFVRPPGDLTVGLIVTKMHLMSNEDLLSLYLALRNMVKARGIELPA